MQLEDNPSLDFIPVTRIVQDRVLSKTAIYALFKEKKLSQFKLGDRTFVSRSEFNSLFKKTN
jgi:hypothetical protein